MKFGFRIVILTSILTAAIVYVVLEWRSQPRVPVEPMVSDSEPGSAEYTSPVQLTFATPSPPPEPVEPDAREVTWDEQNNIDIYRRYSRGVVNITSTTFTYDFFLRAIPASGTGSGAVVDTEGRIVTNFHVIQNSRSLEVTLWDQSRYPATVVGVDPSNDLAVLKVDAPEVDWVPIPFGSTEGLQVGQKVLAIGNPFGLERTLTTGIISSLGRSIRATDAIEIEGVIQTDAAINSGNSGGPLLNSRGEVIGINTAIISGSTGIGFAVPVETVSRVTNDLINYGRVRRVYIGVDASDNLSSFGPVADFLDLGVTSGVLVYTILPDSPAERAGLRGANRRVRIGNRVVPVGGDVVVSVDGRPIRSKTDIRTVIEPYQPGDEIEVTVVRDQQQITLNLTLEELPG